MPTTALTDTATRGPQRALAVAGALAVLLTVVMVGALDAHRLATTTVGLRRTISEYALGPQRWVFDTAVLLLAAGSVAILAVLVRGGLARWRSPGALALLAWSAGLALVVVFPKHDWSVGPSASGTVHRVASLVAFLSLPFAVALLARPWRRDAVWGGHARWAFRFGLLSALAFTPILYAVLVNVVVGTAWWRVLTLGYVERLLVVVEVVAVLVLGRWAIAVAQPAYKPSSTSR
ncbi:DUF998 domain-containing protein [Actinosynnema sp. NPDC047251]|uniref:DUF998 domain-containing protein n=1 Tax=Saccharothrix espanaensis TaxID=103731 RepID=UPI0002F55541|nr:DUF998 domain-containing protein [Saccharothrix espanaensis]